MADIKTVESFWASHVNNEYYTNKDRGSAEYWREIEEKRYRHHYHLTDLFRQFSNSEFKDKRLLEIGCGIGIDSVQLHKCGFNLTAVDLTQNAIDIARERAEQEGYSIKYMVANAEKLPFEDEEMDFVYSFGVLHHTPDIQKSVDEVYRVLKKGGRAYIMLYATYSLVNLIHRLFNIPYESPQNMKDHCPVVYTYDRKGINELFSNFSQITVTKEYPFTYGFRKLTGWMPLFVKRPLGHLFGWHNMIVAEK